MNLPFQANLAAKALDYIGFPDLKPDKGSNGRDLSEASMMQQVGHIIQFGEALQAD